MFPSPEKEGFVSRVTGAWSGSSCTALTGAPPHATLQVIIDVRARCAGFNAVRRRREVRNRQLLGFLDEVARRDTDQQQQRADDRRGARDLHGLALPFGTNDGVEQ